MCWALKTNVLRSMQLFTAKEFLNPGSDSFEPVHIRHVTSQWQN